MPGYICPGDCAPCCGRNGFDCATAIIMLIGGASIAPGGALRSVIPGISGDEMIESANGLSSGIACSAPSDGIGRSRRSGASGGDGGDTVPEITGDAPAAGIDCTGIASISVG